MNEKITEELNILHNKVAINILKVYDIFKEFYGEELVDINFDDSYSNFVYLFKTNRLYYFNRIGSIDIDKEIPDVSDKYLFDLSEEEIVKILKIFESDSTLINALINVFPAYGIIYVKFPEVTVTNEYNKSINLKDIFIKVNISKDGILQGMFELAKATYSFAEYCSGYVHSHVPTLYGDSITEFRHVCTGTGPINSTIAILNRKYDENLWKMFCLELSKYVTVESISGGPYIRLENVSAKSKHLYDTLLHINISDSKYDYPNFSKENLKSFIEYLLKLNILKFKYVDNSYDIGMSDFEFYIKVSNAFIDWANTQPDPIELKNNALKECKIINSKIYGSSTGSRDLNISRDSGLTLLVFKNKEVKIKIEGDTDNELNSLILRKDILLKILFTIIKTINCIKIKNANVNNFSEDESDKTIRYF